MLADKCIPQSREEAKVCMLQKKGDKAEIKNHQPLSLLSGRQTNLDDLDDQQPKEQQGFRDEPLRVSIFELS